MKRFLKNYAVTALCMMLWALVALPAHAAGLSIPAYDVDQACSHASSPKWCVDQEQDGYDLLKTLWDHASDQDKAKALGLFQPTIAKAQSLQPVMLYYCMSEYLTRVLEAEAEWASVHGPASTFKR